MQSLSRGWSFLQEAWRMAFKDNDLIKPSIYSMIVGLIVTIIGIVPLIAAAFLFGVDELIGRVVLFIIGVVLVFVHYVISYVFAGMTVYLIYGYLRKATGARIRLGPLSNASSGISSASPRLRRRSVCLRIRSADETIGRAMPLQE